MAFLSTGDDVGMNSLEMIPFDEQEYNDFTTGEILVAAVKSKADFLCTYPTAESFASFGPSIQSEVQNSIDLAAQNVQTQTAITQESIDAMCAPVISDAAISGAPNAVPVGSATAPSPFTKRQIDAANGDPINWPATLTIQASMQRTIQIRRNQMLSRQQKLQEAQAPFQMDRIQPGPGWGNAAAASKGWCGLGASPLGKLLLFTGLGLIGASLFDRK
jgi:hypothetical protein